MVNVSLLGRLLSPEEESKWLTALDNAPGAFVWVNEEGEIAAPGEEDRMLFSAPGGGGIGACPIRTGGSKKRPVEWDWDGDREKPTLNPSIWFNKGEAGDWHGYLRSGQWEGC